MVEIWLLFLVSFITWIFLFIYFLLVSQVFLYFLKNVEAKMPLFMKQKETQADDLVCFSVA